MLNPPDDGDLLGQRIREIVLVQSKRAGVGHIGSALSVADLVGAVFSSRRPPDPDDPDRDRFVMSKGHAALALYAALALTGVIGADQLDTYCGDDTLLGVHPDHHLRGVDLSTGSLGQGVTVAVGMALAARMAHSSRRVVALVSDAECNEGSVWEAAMFAAQHQLANLTVIVDHNHQQAFGYTAAVLESTGLADRWRSFGWEVEEVDGHDEPTLVDSLRRPLPSDTDAAPRVLVAETVFGKGVSFMEHQIAWHYLPMSDDQFAIALDQVRGPS